MNRSITLAVDVDADAGRVFEVLTTTDGQRAFWTADCELTPTRARFGFPHVGADLEADVTTEPGKLVRMRVTSGLRFPFWEGSTWEWELGGDTLTGTGTGVLFRHYGFAEGYDVGHTAQTWAMILDRLSRYIASGTPQPYFPATAA